ncbi:Beta-barrel assembly machine subunit BamD [Hydrobacter penzbergensis]|jgi:outer membrane protein assembly factor BamD|uniref:Beta-barrel assembly machine subunit BamD n=1 Tax=Hydrobacter penzbergensis TaxID=1235997 RepID=A0A8X8LFB7_9BACT|nr:outer membrane protein assembly factor BamD [Hydrobacter penzbergensis]MBN8720803.1 outer membrane protein assembly factor BamD [Sediminibacterium magnilacihabitans]PQV58193.1 Beta-barrel assembly machine subunit BamD [Sediminibacterium magnilacihabitans]SDX60723.1 Beta-barrel assembly machine subunit BamD [Hydrobacter penzbergensis]
MNRTPLLLAFVLLLSACSNKFSKIFKSKDYEYKSKMAEQYYANKDYSHATQLFEDVFPYVKGTARYEDMYYKYAYSYYYDKDYLNAENLFKNFVENFPTSNKSEECDYMRAYCYFKQSPKTDLDQTNTNKTMQLMQVFINTHPNSARVKDASEIIDKCRAKLEEKDFKAAQLYYNLGYYKAAAIAFANVSDNFPDSKKADEYKYQTIRSYYKYAQMSYEEKQKERYEKVISECRDFTDRFTDSKFSEEVNKYKTHSNNFLNNLKNEQAKKANER